MCVGVCGCVCVCVCACVNILFEIKAQIIKFISRLLSFDHFFGQYKNFNIDRIVLKCKIINKPSNFKSMPNIYKELLLV